MLIFHQKVLAFLNTFISYIASKLEASLYTIFSTLDTSQALDSAMEKRTGT